MAGCRPVGYLHITAEELNWGQLRTNPVNSRVEDLNPGSSDYKSSLYHSLVSSEFMVQSHLNFLWNVLIPLLVKQMKMFESSNQSKNLVSTNKNTMSNHLRKEVLDLNILIRVPVTCGNMLGKVQVWFCCMIFSIAVRQGLRKYRSTKIYHSGLDTIFFLFFFCCWIKEYTPYHLYHLKINS